jgi:hypothetical protein
MQNFAHDVVFLEKRQFFRQKLSKIAENCDHNIDPWSPCIALSSSTALPKLGRSRVKIFFVYPSCPMLCF